MRNYRPIPKLTEEQRQRFWSRVEVPNQPSCCWEWTGALTDRGYAEVSLDGLVFKSHRVAYSDLIESVPTDKMIDHLCRNRKCVNPDHLQIASDKMNVRTGFSPSGVHARKTHCPQGHPYDNVNTYWWNGTNRQCKTCKREHDKRPNHRRSA
jgi:hypothetical protein